MFNDYLLMMHCKYYLFDTLTLFKWPIYTLEKSVEIIRQLLNGLPEQYDMDSKLLASSQYNLYI